MARPRPTNHPDLDPSLVLGRAFVRAASGVGMTKQRVAKLLGVSPATVTRVFAGRGIGPETKEGELGLLFLRVYRSLDAVLGGDQSNMRAWLGAHNLHLGGVPIEMIETVTGLVSVADYLDAMRGKV